MTPGKAQVPGTETPHESASAGAQPGIHPEGQTTRVAFLGPQGTFTEQALQQMIAAGYLPGSTEGIDVKLSLIHISEPTRLSLVSRMPSSA